jgi:stage V sporulation protein R
MTLTPELEKWRQVIHGHARDYGLDFFEVIYEILSYEEMNAIASYGGFPTRYPHWRFGMEHEQLSKSYAFGLHKIYEMVINNDPCYAYLLDANPVVDQKIVMAHVYGHSDFFKNNAWFSKTNRKMMDQMANHATRIRRLIDKHGLERVENFIDCCLSLENLIDPHSQFIRRQRADDEGRDDRVHKLRSKDYMQDFINPPDVLEAEQERIKQDRERERSFPEEPVRDVLLFLLNHAPLKSWESEVLSIIRDEAYYFAPQAQTKIMNEGWAAYWHSTMMTAKLLDASELIDYADHHSGTLGGGSRRLNPYKLGIELFRDIEDRWNKGRFGKDYEECSDVLEKQNWDLKLGQGREKIFEVRRVHNDITFIDNFMTEDFCRRHRMFSFSYDQKTGNYHIDSRKFQQVKRGLLFQLTNSGQPIIHVKNANHRNRSEMLLYHQHEGIDLKMDYARETLRNLHRIWKRPVNLETVSGETAKILHFDGENFSDEEVKQETPSSAAGES